MWPAVSIASLLPGLAAYLAYRQLRNRGLHRCLADYLRRLPGPAPRRGQPVHLLLCLADHYEPRWGDAPPDVARRRVAAWVDRYPQMFGGFADSDGRRPRHTFFYPSEEYEPGHLDALAGLCRAGFGEVEIHLHHGHDTAAALRENLAGFRDVLAGRHGLLAADRRTGAVRYGFIHGNWALCNWFGDGRHCGVNEEIDVLRATGCYADFTMPSAPAPTQCPRVNRLYYARNRPGRPRSHEHGTDAGAGPPPADALLMVQGPLVLTWRRGRLAPALENGCLQASQPPDVARVAAWLRARVQVPARPDWFFVKLHMHGAPEESHGALLGEPMARFHAGLARLAREDPGFHYHYVTAREMYNLVKAAESGWTGTVADARDRELVWRGGA